jgi:hypothetical protein
MEECSKHLNTGRPNNKTIQKLTFLGSSYMADGGKMVPFKS